jgi:hypothetical protein
VTAVDPLRATPTKRKDHRDVVVVAMSQAPISQRRGARVAGSWPTMLLSTLIAAYATTSYLLMAEESLRRPSTGARPFAATRRSRAPHEPGAVERDAACVGTVVTLEGDSS